MNLLRSIELALLRQREYRKARAELETYSERELNSDLRLNRSDIPALAAEAAEQRVAAFGRSHPTYRRAPARPANPPNVQRLGAKTSTGDALAASVLMRSATGRCQGRSGPRAPPVPCRAYAQKWT